MNSEPPEAATQAEATKTIQRRLAHLVYTRDPRRTKALAYIDAEIAALKASLRAFERINAIRERLEIVAGAMDEENHHESAEVLWDVLDDMFAHGAR